MLSKPFTRAEVDRLPVPVWVMAGFMLTVLEEYTMPKWGRGFVPTYDCRCAEPLSTDHV